MPKPDQVWGHEHWFNKSYSLSYWTFLIHIHKPSLCHSCFQASAEWKQNWRRMYSSARHRNQVHGQHLASAWGFLGENHFFSTNNKWIPNANKLHRLLKKSCKLKISATLKHHQVTENSASQPEKAITFYVHPPLLLAAEVSRGNEISFVMQPQT